MAINKRKSKNRRKVGLKESLARGLNALRDGGLRLAPMVALAAIALGIPFASYEAYRYAVSSEYFALRIIDIAGTDVVTHDQILQTGMIGPGMNVFDVDVERVETLLVQHAWIKEVEVERRLPDGVQIRIVERAPAAVLVGQAYDLIEADGTVFKRIESTDPVDELLALPLISGPTHASTTTEDGRAQIRQALSVLAEYHVMELDKMHPVSEVHVDPVMGVSLVTTLHGTEIRLGEGRVTERLQRLRVVMAALDEDELEADYVLIDHEQDLDRVIVGTRTFAGMDASNGNGAVQ